MPSTYSVNPGTITEAFKLIDLNTVLNELPDNTSKLIEPHDLRDAIFTTWENIVFKPTIGSAGIEYIGIDSSTLYEKIFLGKKQIAGSDILNTNLLSSDVDIFLYNTKTDSNLSNQNLKIGFLAGISQSVFYGTTLSIPTIEVKSIGTYGGNVLDFNIYNNSYTTYGGTSYGGNVALKTSYGNIIVNDLILPTVQQNNAASDGQILTYKKIGGYNYMIWATNSVSVNNINAAGTFSIDANPLMINGYDAMFNSIYPTPFTVGGIPAGTSFSSSAVTEVLRQLLYPYTAPYVTLTSDTSYIEVSSSNQTINFSYSITKYVGSSTISSILTTPVFITSTSIPLTYLNVPTVVTYNGTGSYTSAAYFSTPGIKGFTLSVTDNLGSTSSVNYNVNAIYPIFYGTSMTVSSTQSFVQGILPGLNKILTNTPNQTVPMQGDGVCLYYLVPEILNMSGSMSALYDSNAPLINSYNVFRGNGTPFTMSLNSPSVGLWAGVVYNCYIYSPFGGATATTIGLPTLYTANYQFVF